jgi:hypothetical protein
MAFVSMISWEVSFSNNSVFDCWKTSPLQLLANDLVSTKRHVLVKNGLFPVKDLNIWKGLDFTTLFDQPRNSWLVSWDDEQFVHFANGRTAVEFVVGYPAACP